MGNPDSHAPARQDYKRQSVYIPGDLHIFTGRCRDCGGAYTINVKDLKTGGHSSTIICPHCGVRHMYHTD